MSTSPSHAEVLFADALALPPAKRGAFLAKECGANVDLLAHLVALVAAHEGPESLTPPDFGPAESAGDVVNADVSAAALAKAEEKAGDAIGRYKLLQKIGEGGCGVVWMAEQEEPVRRRVALKVIKLGMDTKAVVARFEAERQALAMMDHPNIAKVHDAGSTETGRPYFVMELVRGIPITKYCDENHLTPEARLELFIKVCQAVQHAHQKGIIHRDLKPSNILVTVNDGAPTPKIIDFGIAKATQGRLTDATVFTAFEQFIGTPVYMSPEQAEMSSLDIDTRSDIYSLGVLLYELLTGKPPFDPKAFAQAGVDQIRKQIREVEPARPSARLRTLTDEEQTTIARLRGTAASSLSLALRGDLDWIVMRCIEKDRTRRYDTANGLAMDIQRYLRNEPVVARPPSTGYLLQKLIRRNRVAFAGGVAVAVVLVAGAVVSTWQAVRATRAERAQSRLRLESEFARTESDRARVRAEASEKSERQLREHAVEEQQLGLKRSSRADFKLASRLLDEGNAGEGLAYLVRAARSDPQNLVVGPRMIHALVTRNFLLPEHAPLNLPSAVKWISFTPDGSAVWVLGEDGIVRVLDHAGSRITREFSFAKKVLHVALAERNHGIFAVYLDDHSLVVCDAVTGRAHLPAILPEQKLGKNGFPRLSADGRWLAAASEGEVWIWDTDTRELRATLPHPGLSQDVVSAAPGVVSALDFSPDGRRIATTAFFNYVRIWSVPDGAPLTPRIPTGDKECSAVRFSPDGRLIIVSAFTGAQIRDGKTGARVGPLLPHNAPVNATVFTSDNRLVITTSPDHTAKVWHVATGELVFPALHHAGTLYRWSTVGISDDGKLLLTTSADGFTRVWDLETGQLLAAPALQQNQTPNSVLSPDGTRVIIGTRSGRVFSLRLERGSARPLVLPRGSDFFAVGLVPATPVRLRRFTGHRMEIIDVASGREIAGGFAFPEPVTEWGNLRSDGRFLAVRTKSRQHQVWEASEGRVRVVALQDTPNDDAWFQFCAASDLLSMVGFGSREIRVWNLQTGRPVAQPMELAEKSFILTHDFSPDGKRLAAGAMDGTVRVWDINSAQTLFDLTPLPSAQVNRVAFSPDGTRIVTANDLGEVRLWDGVNGRPISPVLRHRTRTDGATFSPDGRILATSSFDGTARVWDAHEGAAIGEPMVHPGILANVQFNTDGSRIATVSGDGTGRVWDTRTGLPLSEAMRHHETLVWHDLVQAANGQFSPGDGRFVCTFSANHIYLWAIPPDGGAAPVPEWLLRLATICAGKRVTADGVLDDASDEVAKIDEVRREIAALGSGAPFAEWGKWFFADRATRSIAPGFTITPAEAEKLAATLPAEAR